MTDWYVKAREYANCNCSYGCNCQFNALPNNGFCCAMGSFRIDEGRHGDVRLDDLCAVGVFAWPGPVHEGNGRMQLIIDERADARQRAALERIMLGQDTKEMATMWWIYSAMAPNRLPTLYRPIDLHIDVDARRATLEVPGLVESVGEPIRNPITKLEHRVRIDLPHGFEYELAEIGSGRTSVKGEIPLELKDSYGQFARIHLNQDGVVRGAPRAREAAAAA
jgi:hypothetical protein